MDFVITSDPVQFPEGIAGLDKGYPRGRIGEPEDIANLCLFLASKYAANITGQDICCDGGIMAMGGWNDNIGYKSCAPPRTVLAPPSCADPRAADTE